MSPPKSFVAALLGVWLVAALPIAAADLLPLVDDPSHLARVHLLAHWNQLTGYEKFYRPAWGLLPNLGLELITVPLAWILPTAVAMRVFCVLVVGLFVWGGALLIRAVSGRWTVWSFAPALLVYNLLLAFGFLSYVLGCGVGLFALAHHIHGRAQSVGKRVLREFAFMLALFISHLVAFAVYVIAAAAYDALSTMVERRRWKELLTDYAVLGVSGSIPVLLMFFSRTREHVNVLEFSDVVWKLHKFAEVFESGQGTWDVVFAIAMVASLGSLLAAGYLRVERVMAGVAIVLVVVFALVPYRVNAATSLDTRLPLWVLFAAVAALVPRDARSRAVSSTLLALFVFRVTTTTLHYQRSSAALERISAELTVVPAGSLVFTARQASAPVWVPHDWHPPRPHASELLLLTRPVFSATLLTVPTHQPLVRSGEFEKLGVPPEIGDASQTELERYAERMTARLARAGRTEPSYVYLMKGPIAPAQTPGFEVIVDRPAYALYRLVR